MTISPSTVDDDLAVYKTDGNAGDRAVPRDIGDGDRDRGTDHRGDLGSAVGIHGHHGGDDTDVVAHILGEQRTDRAVDDAGGQDRLLAGSALTAHIAAGDLTHGIELLFIVHGQREEVDAVPRLCGSGRRYVDDGLAVAYQTRAVGELGHFAGLNDQRSARELGLEHAVLVKSHSLVSHRVTSCILVFHRISGLGLAIKPKDFNRRDGHCPSADDRWSSLQILSFYR